MGDKSEAYIAPRPPLEPVILDPTELFPIRTLSERSGVGASRLRAWERRYGLLAPARTPKGHRLYHEKDVRLVQQVLALLEEGHTLSAIAKRLKQGSTDEAGDWNLREQAGIWSDYLAATLQAVRDFSTERLEAVYNEASSLYPVNMVTERLIQPALKNLGKNWQSRRAGIAEEHFYCSWLRNRLGARFHHALSQAGGARILCACVPESYHETGLMLFSIAALTRGYRVLYLGANLPLDQIAAVQDRSGARGVVLSSREEIDASREERLANLLSSVNVPVLLGGPGSDQPLPVFEEAGGVRLGSRIAVALCVLGSHVSAFGDGGSRGPGRRG